MGTDAYKHEPWEVQKLLAFRDFKDRCPPGTPGIMEGVTAARVARMEPPAFEALVYLTGPDRSHTKSLARDRLGDNVAGWVRESVVPVYTMEVMY